MDVFKCFHQFFVLLFLSIFATACFPEIAMSPIAGDVCASKNCGQGTCKASNTLFGYECICNYGWKQLKVGPVVFPPCVLPNYTINFNWGTSPSPLLLSLTPAPPVYFQLSDPCSLTWCGDGTCIPNGTNYSCKCNSGSANLQNSSNLPCLKPCFFGQDCQGLNAGPKPPGLPPGPAPRGSQPTIVCLILVLISPSLSSL